MAIRIRAVEGVVVALCAAETDDQDGDIYLDDNQHMGLAAKFAHDWQGQCVDWGYPIEWALMKTQKLRDAKEELTRWLDEKRGEEDGMIDTDTEER